jgi:ArsR family transcriptional regulator
MTVAVMKNIVTFSKALADPTRWRIIRLVTNQALCVCELADILEMRQSSVSSHVQIIRRAGLLESEKCEKWTYFQIHEDYRGLILSLSGFFHGSDSLFFPTDATRSIQRLTERESSCCPGPQTLNSKKLTTV